MLAVRHDDDDNDDYIRYTKIYLHYQFKQLNTLFLVSISLF